MVCFPPVGYGVHVADVLRVSPSSEQTAPPSAPTKG